MKWNGNRNVAEKNIRNYLGNKNLDNKISTTTTFVFWQPNNSQTDRIFSLGVSVFFCSLLFSVPPAGTWNTESSQRVLFCFRFAVWRFFKTVRPIGYEVWWIEKKEPKRGENDDGKKAQTENAKFLMRLRGAINNGSDEIFIERKWIFRWNAVKFGQSALAFSSLSFGRMFRRFVISIKMTNSRCVNWWAKCYHMQSMFQPQHAFIKNTTSLRILITSFFPCFFFCFEFSSARSEWKKFKNLDFFFGSRAPMS